MLNFVQSAAFFGENFPSSENEEAVREASKNKVISVFIVVINYWKALNAPRTFQCVFLTISGMTRIHFYFLKVKTSNNTSHSKKKEQREREVECLLLW